MKNLLLLIAVFVLVSAHPWETQAEVRGHPWEENRGIAEKVTEPDGGTSTFTIPSKVMHIIAPLFMVPLECPPPCALVCGWTSNSEGKYFLSCSCCCQHLLLPSRNEEIDVLR